MKHLPLTLAALFAVLSVPAVYVGAVIAQHLNNIFWFPFPAALCIAGAAYWIGVAEANE